MAKQKTRIISAYSVKGQQILTQSQGYYLHSIPTNIANINLGPGDRSGRAKAAQNHVESKTYIDRLRAIVAKLKTETDNFMETSDWRAFSQKIMRTDGDGIENKISRIVINFFNSQEARDVLMSANIDVSGISRDFAQSYPNGLAYKEFCDYIHKSIFVGAQKANRKTVSKKDVAVKINELAWVMEQSAVQDIKDIVLDRMTDKGNYHVDSKNTNYVTTELSKTIASKLAERISGQSNILVEKLADRLQNILYTELEAKNNKEVENTISQYIKAFKAHGNKVFSGRKLNMNPQVLRGYLGEEFADVHINALGPPKDSGNEINWYFENTGTFNDEQVNSLIKKMMKQGEISKDIFSDLGNFDISTKLLKPDSPFSRTDDILIYNGKMARIQSKHSGSFADIKPDRKKKYSRQRDSMFRTFTGLKNVPIEDFLDRMQNITGCSSEDVYKLRYILINEAGNARSNVKIQSINRNRLIRTGKYDASVSKNSVIMFLENFVYTILGIVTEVPTEEIAEMDAQVSIANSNMFYRMGGVLIPTYIMLEEMVTGFITDYGKRTDASDLGLDYSITPANVSDPQAFYDSKVYAWWQDGQSTPEAGIAKGAEGGNEIIGNVRIKINMNINLLSLLTN